MPLVLHLTAGANVVIALAFFTIASMILAGLIRDRALGIHPLGVATALVFLSCAAGHAMHAENYFLNPDFYAANPNAGHMLLFDSFTLVAGLGYLAQRRRYGLVIRGAHPMIDYQRRLQMAEALREIGQDIAAQTDFDTLLRLVVSRARDLLGGDYAVIVTQDASGKPYCQAAGTRTFGSDAAAWNEAVFLPEMGEASGGKAPPTFLVIDDLRSGASGKGGGVALHRMEGGRTVLAVAVRRGDVLSGSLMIAYRTRRKVTPDDVSSAAALASQAAVAIEKARLIESLRQSDRMKDEFLSAAAHELKTPVTAIMGWTDVLLGPSGERANQRKALASIRRQAERMTRLSEDLLAVMSLQPALGPISFEETDLSDLARQAVERVQELDERRKYVFWAAGPLTVEADQRLIVEALLRLLENAIHYSPAGKPIEIETRTIHGDAVVRVKDYGIGIPEDRQAHIFEPFYEPIPSGREGYVGSVSLGLHLSKQIVEAHGGRIWVSSSPGEGSTFSIGLPLRPGATNPQLPLSERPVDLSSQVEQ